MMHLKLYKTRALARVANSWFFIKKRQNKLKLNFNIFTIHILFKINMQILKKFIQIFILHNKKSENIISHVQKQISKQNSV
jgi:hypothetical protein